MGFHVFGLCTVQKIQITRAERLPLLSGITVPSMAMQTLHLKQHYGMGVGSESVHVWCWGQLKPFSMEHPSSGDRQFTKQPETTEEQRNHGVFTVLIPGSSSQYLKSCISIIIYLLLAQHLLHFCQEIHFYFPFSWEQINYTQLFMSKRPIRGKIIKIKR